MKEKLNNNNFIQDDEGNSSSMRIVVLFGVAIIIIVWLVICFMTKTFIDFPPGVCWVLGIFIFGKSTQKGVEVFKIIKKKE